MENLIILILAVLPVIAGIILLQIFLSKKYGKWLGLILPAISFLLSFAYPLFSVDLGDTAQNIWSFIIALLLGNIPTVILLAIYAVIREKRRRKAQLEKMNVQDLG